VENLEPKTRLEQFLSAIAGNDIELPEVKTRLEYFLKEIADNGGGGGSSGGDALLIRVADQPMETIPEWIIALTEDEEHTVVYETNVTFQQLATAVTSSVIGIYLPHDSNLNTVRATQCPFTDIVTASQDGMFFVGGEALIAVNKTLTISQLEFYANAANGTLYLTYVAQYD
jgi:hypothetical protein